MVIKGIGVGQEKPPKYYVKKYLLCLKQLGNIPDTVRESWGFHFSSGNPVDMTTVKVTIQQIQINQTLCHGHNAGQKDVTRNNNWGIQ